MNLKNFSHFGHDLVSDVRGGLDQVNVRFAFQSLLNDFHVKETKEAAAKTEAQSIAGFRFKFKTRVVDRKLGQRVSQFREILPVGRIQTTVNHSGRFLISRKSGPRLFTRNADGVTNLDFVQRFDVADDVSHFSRLQFLAGASFGRELPQFKHLVNTTRIDEVDFLSLEKCPIHHTNISDHSAKFVVMRVKHHRLKRRVSFPFRWWNSFQNRAHEIGNSNARLGADSNAFVHRQAEGLLHFQCHFVCSLVLQINFVDDRDYGQIMSHRGVNVGDGLRLNPLKCVHKEQGAFATG